MSLDNSNLNSLTKKELIELINGLRTENSVLKELQIYMNQSNERLEKLEREQNRHIQYQMRDTIEISGIPISVKQNVLEGEVLKIFETAGVEVNGYILDYYQIQACHRIRKNGVTICKFVNRKFANNAIYSGWQKSQRKRIIRYQLRGIYKQFTLQGIWFFELSN